MPWHEQGEIYFCVRWFGVCDVFDINFPTELAISPRLGSVADVVALV